MDYHEADGPVLQKRQVLGIGQRLDPVEPVHGELVVVGANGVVFTEQLPDRRLTGQRGRSGERREQDDK